jgi:Ca2+-binding EF-hand superfamily protein
MGDDAKIRALFERYDTNKNGVLERDEFFVVFKQILSEMGENFPDKKNDEVAEEGMNNFDLNKNGTIEYNEFVELINFLISEKGYTLK